MTPKTLAFALSPIALALLLSSCGGGSSTGSNTPEPDTGAALGVDNNQAGGHSTGAQISGRVADGYIQGATVCVDLNESDSCDDNEPSAVTVEGGAYTLTVPAGAEDKPIVADIPAEAIDEDTGEAVGRKLVFTAPAEKPTFLSPITTLVQQELKSNPSLGVNEAESAVKTVLGINEESDVSLFEDYIAEAVRPEADEERSEQFEYLHDTARVIASMMKDIESQVESAVSETGADVAGDLEAQKAIRELVRTEVRKLLPDIARNVAEIVASNTSNPEESIDGESAAPVFDPDRIALELRPADAVENIDERLDAIKDRPEVEEVDMQNLLTEGLYWIDLYCHHDYQYGTGQPTVNDKVAYDDGPGVNIDYKIESYPRICEAHYGFVELSEDGSQLVTSEFVFDAATAGWVVESREADEFNADYALVEGQWKKVDAIGPAGEVTFTEDGAALISNEAGQLLVRAVSQSLGGKPVLSHLWENQIDPVWFDSTDPSATFSADSETYRLSIRESSHPYVLFNMPAELGNPEGCLEFGDNCNVIHTQLDEGQQAVTSLDQIREASLNDVNVMGAGYGGPDLGSTMTLTAQMGEDGALPTQGIARWNLDYSLGLESSEYYEAEHGVDEEYCIDVEIHEPGVIVVDNMDADFSADQFPDIQLSESQHVENDLYAQTELQCAPIGDVDTFESATGVQFEITESELTDGEFSENSDLDIYPDLDSVLTSDWRVVRVDGVAMIEIDLPFAKRAGEDADEAILLIEHEGFVRLGARLPESYIDVQSTYNVTAFENMRAIAESVLADDID